MDRFPRNDIISLVSETPRYDLAESVGPDLLSSDLIDGALAASGDIALAYGTAEGGQALREAIAQRNGVRADQVVITTGGMHALFLAAFVLCRHGDEAIVANPIFPLARNALLSVGAVTRALPMPFDKGYLPDLDAFRALLTDKTRIVSVASPQNPSGVAIPTQTLRGMIALMRAHAPQAWLVVDETYREAAYGDDAVAPGAATLGERVVSVASLSKCHGAPGLRIGWAITQDAALRAALVTAKFNTVITCSPLDEAMANELLDRSERILGDRRRVLATNLRIMRDWVHRNDAFVEWVEPSAGALCCIRMRPGVFDESDAERLVNALAKTGVRLAPGAWFGDEARVFRIGFGHLPVDELHVALELVAQALRDLAVEHA